MKHKFMPPNNFTCNQTSDYNVDVLESNKQNFFFFAEINEKEKLSKALNKCITALDYADKTFLLLSSASSGVCLTSFGTATGRPVVSVSVSFQ